MSKLHISVAPEKITEIGPITVTNSLVTGLAVMVILIVLGIYTFNQKEKKTKGKFYTVIEAVVGGLYGFLGNILGDKTEKLFPLMMTLFLFIIIGNWIGLLPGVGSIGFYHQGVHGEEFIPLLRSPNADLNTTIALALISVVVTHYLSISALGIRGYISRFINISSPIKFFVGILETISEFAKILSFSFRLFGNIFAGEVLLLVITFLIPFILPVPFLILEIFVGFIQALVFVMLTSIFIVVATNHHDG